MSKNSNEAKTQTSNEASGADEPENQTKEEHCACGKQTRFDESKDCPE